MVWKSKEAEREYKAKYYRENKTRLKEKSRAWAKENPEKRRAIGYRYDSKHRESNAARGRRWYVENSERAKANRSSWSKANRQNVLLKGAKRRAKLKGLDFTIRIEDIEIPERCPIFGVEFEFGTRGYCPNNASLDRIDSSLGYVPGNIWVISYRANVIKNDGTPEEHEKIALATRLALKFNDTNSTSGRPAVDKDN